MIGGLCSPAVGTEGIIHALGECFSPHLSHFLIPRTPKHSGICLDFKSNDRKDQLFSSCSPWILPAISGHVS
eukprot:2725217-Rhodomonas_salina.2